MYLREYISTHNNYTRHKKGTGEKANRVQRVNIYRRKNTKLKPS